MCAIADFPLWPLPEVPQTMSREYGPGAAGHSGSEESWRAKLHSISSSASRRSHNALEWLSQRFRTPAFIRR